MLDLKNILRLVKKTGGRYLFNDPLEPDGKPYIILSVDDFQKLLTGNSQDLPEDNWDRVGQISGSKYGKVEANLGQKPEYDLILGQNEGEIDPKGEEKFYYFES